MKKTKRGRKNELPSSISSTHYLVSFLTYPVLSCFHLKDGSRFKHRNQIYAHAIYCAHTLHIKPQSQLMIKFDHSEFTYAWIKKTMAGKSCIGKNALNTFFFSSATHFTATPLNEILPDYHKYLITSAILTSAKDM